MKQPGLELTTPKGLRLLTRSHPSHTEPAGATPLPVPVAEILTVDGTLWEAFANPRDLQGRLFSTSKEDACKTLCTFLLEHAGAPDLAFTDWKKVCALGIDYPEASPHLHVWEPVPAAADNLPESPLTDVKNDTLIIPANLPSPMTYTLAATRIHQKLPCDLVFASPRHSGYLWYDRAPRLQSFSVSFLHDRAPLDPADLPGWQSHLPAIRPHDIILTLNGTGPNGNLKYPQHIPYYLPGIPDDWHTRGHEPVVSVTARLLLNDVKALLRNAYFNPARNNNEIPSLTDQRFDEQSHATAARMTLDATEALRESLRYVAHAALAPYLNKTRRFSVNALGNSLEVHLKNP